MKLYELLYVIDGSLSVWVSTGYFNEYYESVKDIPQEYNLASVEMVTTDAQGNINISIIE